jgi:hypothetical protein
MKEPPELARVKFSILKILPVDVSKWAEGWDGENYIPVKNKKIPEGCKLRWNIKFIVQDYAHQTDKTEYLIRLREGFFFKGMKPSKWLDEKEQKKAVKIKRILLKYHLNFLDVLVTKQKGGFFIKETFFNSLKKPKMAI